MKIVLDLTDLVQRGELTGEEAKRLERLAAKDSGALGVNILLAFGVVAVAAGAAVFIPSPETAAAIGALMFLCGFALIVTRQERWTLFARIMATLGALAFVAGVMFLTESNIYVNFALAAGLAVAAAVASSGLLGALAILQLSVALGSGTAYWHASYGLWVERPALSIAVLALVTLGLYLASKRVGAGHERVAIIAARTAIMMVNAAFLVGTLFGDPMLNWPAGVFIWGWAAVLAGIGVWGVWANRRWVVNMAAVFGALHFYTQWFENLGATPLTVIGGGALLIGFAFALRWFNLRVNRAKTAGA